MKWLLRVFGALRQLVRPDDWPVVPLTLDEMRAIKRRALQQRVQADLDEGNSARAISRLETTMMHQCFDPALRRWLARVYLQTGQIVKAGKYLYLVADLQPGEQAAVAAFEASLGHCPLGICRKLTPARFGYQRLDAYSRQRYQDLICQIERRFGVVPKFLRGVKTQLDKHGVSPATI